MKSYHIEIEGMGCAHCVRGVEEALSAIGAQVNGCAIGSADVRFDGAVDALREAVESRGFEVSAITEV